MNSKYILLRKQLLFCFVCSSFLALNGQSSKIIIPDWQTNLSTAISKKGYQSVALVVATNQLYIYYENRVQRFEPQVIIDVIKTIGVNNFPIEVETIHLITQKLQQPLVTTSFTVKDLKSWTKGAIPLTTFVNSIDIRQGGKRLKKQKNKVITNSGNYSLELEIKPQIGLGLGGFPDAVVHRFYLLPTFNVHLWKGAQLQMEIILPISSEFDITGEHFIRPGILSFSQTIRLPKQLWLQGAIGYFSKNRYGGRLSTAKFLFNGSLSITGEIGYTGYASYPMKLGVEKAIKGWEYADIDYLDYSVGMAYWFKDWNTQVKLEYAKVLFNKKQVKLSVLQRFNEVDIGFFALKTERGNNYGMQLNIPIFPKKYWNPKRLSIRPAHSLNYTYHATQFFADQYKTGNAIADFYRQLNPEFIKKQLQILERWEVK